MSSREIDKTSSLDSAPDGAIGSEDAVAEEPRIGGDGRQERSPAGQEEKVKSGKAEEEVIKLDEEEEEDKAPAVAQPTSATAANAKTLFGMKRSNPTVKKGNNSYDYEQKYPEDAPNEEAAPASRVWRTYEDESRNHDANMVEESRDNVDVLLVFAGLFSAVVTTFVAQTSQSLQPDYAAMSASLLYESVLVQRAIANGSPVNIITPSPLNPTIAFVPATTDVWVNGLWFTSLFLSLTTALVAVLVKQWLHHYVALPSGTPCDRSFIRQFRYAGFEKWHVQVIIGLLPVLMHLALAIFLSGLVIFLQPLRAALSWIICAGTVLVYTAYVVATILPILFPQCPYRTPLCDLVYLSLCSIVPQMKWYNEEDSEDEDRRWASSIFRYLPRVQARTPQSLTTIESKFVQQTSTDLAAEALHWLFSVSSNPSVQSIVIQSIGGLPIASAEKLLNLQAYPSKMGELRESLVEHCLLDTKVSKHWPYYEPVPGMELKLGRLLRFSGDYRRYSFIHTPGIYSFELTAAILSNSCTLLDRETLNNSVSSDAFLMENIGSSKLLPRGWRQLMKSWDVFRRLDPDHDNHANMFPLHLCSAILSSFDAPRKGDFDPPLVLDFKDALPYFLDKIHDRVLYMFSEFNKDPSSVDEPPSPESLRVLAVAIKFLLHRLSLPDYDTSHTTILELLKDFALRNFKRTFSSQEATAVIPVIEDIIADCVRVTPLESRFGSDHRDSDLIKRNSLAWYTILTYKNLSRIAPSACSLHGLQSTVNLMTSCWEWSESPSKFACEMLTNLLVKHIPVAFTVFRETQCLEFLGNHKLLEASIPFVRAYITGIFAMQRGSDVDAATHQLHIDYLHNPDNLFTVCSILAIHDIRTWNRDRRAIRRDIMTLVKLHPRDAAWDECRRKLRDLVRSDKVPVVDFLRKGSPYTIYHNEIQVVEDNITDAIHVLDDFLDGRTHTIMGHLYRTLGLRRKPEDKPEQEQQV